MICSTLFVLALSLPNSSADEADGHEGWRGLDLELQGLAASTRADGGVHLSGFMAIRWDSSSDVTPGGAPADPNGYQGFKVENARVAIHGDVGDFGFRIQPDFASSNVLKDAKVWWIFASEYKLTVGQYKVPFSKRYQVSRERMAFLDRSLYLQKPEELSAGPPAVYKGGYAYRDQGIKVGGAHEKLSWDVSLSNGADATASQYTVAGRAEFALQGGGAPNYEGGYGIGDESVMTVGGGLVHDATLDTGPTSWTLDALWALNPITVGASIVGNGAGYTVAQAGTETAWDVYGTYMITPNEWELALRYEFDDDPGATEVLTLGVNRYLYGPGSKWQLNYKDISRSAGNPEGVILEAGLVLDF